MLAVDTNVLIRILVNDPDAPRQCAAAREVASNAKVLYLPQVVQIETVWVLERAYGFSKSRVVNQLQQIADNVALVLQRPEVFRQALEEYRTGSADFSDYMILVESRIAGDELATFDRKLGKHQGSLAVTATSK